MNKKRYFIFGILVGVLVQSSFTSYVVNKINKQHELEITEMRESCISSMKNIGDTCVDLIRESNK